MAFACAARTRQLRAGGASRRDDACARSSLPRSASSRAQLRSPRTSRVSSRCGGAGPLAVEVEPLMDDQELDARASTGTVYWKARSAPRRRRQGGARYLEMTGYWKPLKRECL